MSARAEDYLNQFPDHDQIHLVGPLAEAGLRIREPVIFVDGGSQRREGGIGITVGDGDSSLEKMDIELDPVKDYSDLAFALGLLGARFTTVTLSGFLGGRRDHELFNLGEVHHFLCSRPLRTRVLLDDELVGYGAGQWEFTVRGTFSLATLAETAVSLSGECAYPIESGTVIKPLNSLGLSNEGDGIVVLGCAGPVFVFHVRDRVAHC